MAGRGKGIKAAKVSPAYLHSNSTSHTWPFSAIAELIDNAYDPDVGAKEISIDHRVINKNDTLCFKDNGHGMGHEQLFKMLSFGFSEKTQVRDVKPIGRYGNGFKSGSMRLGDDVLVFTRCTTSTSVGLLSQTYLKAINAESVLVPIVTWDLPSLTLRDETDASNNLQAILDHSIFKSKPEIEYTLKHLKKMKTGTGTYIIIYNLKRNKNGFLELDFQSDPDDIRNPETAVFDDTSIERPLDKSQYEYKRSLREYCSILYLRPRMKIVLREKEVVTKIISNSLRRIKRDNYKPRYLDSPVTLTFGFSTSRRSKEYGLMLYHNNRLIRAYEKVGCQTKANADGVGVVGIVEADFLEPEHNKQTFKIDGKYTTFMKRAAIKLNDYFYERTGAENPDNVDDSTSTTSWRWANCNQCSKWRRLPIGYNEPLPVKWFCRLNPDSQFNRCDIPQEPDDEDRALQASYNPREVERTQQKKREEELQSTSNFSSTHRTPAEAMNMKGEETLAAGANGIEEIINTRSLRARKGEQQITAATKSFKRKNYSPTSPTPQRQKKITRKNPDKVRKMPDGETVAAEEKATTDLLSGDAENNNTILDSTDAETEGATTFGDETMESACQTDPTTFVSPEEKEEMEMTKLKLKDLQIKVCQMLNILKPDFNFGNPEEIGTVISDFINAEREVDHTE